VTPPEVSELSSRFRQLVGWHTKGQKAIHIWKIHRIVLNDQVRKLVFPSPRLWSTDAGKPISHQVEILQVELIIYPLGMGLVSIQLDWLPQTTNNNTQMGNSSSCCTPGLSLDAFQTWLFIGKHRHKVSNIALGWTLGDATTPTFETQIAELGPTLSQALNKGVPCSLGSIMRWLLQLKNDDSQLPPLRLSNSKYAFHHTTVVLSQELSPEKAQDYLFHLRRAYGSRKSRPKFHSTQSTADQVLIPHVNRYIGICREGTVSLSWSSDKQKFGKMNEKAAISESRSHRSFEFTEWPRKFQGIYGILCIQVLGERVVLEELGNHVALHVDSIESSPSELLFTQIQEIRNRMRDLSILLVRFMLSMSSDDCGGPSAYFEFFHALSRLVIGVPELREELQDVLKIVESYFLEEARRIKDEKKRERREERERKEIIERDRQKHGKWLELTTSVLAAILIPIFLVSAIWGMNNVDLPQVSWYPLMGITVGVSFILFLFYITCLRKTSRLTSS